MVEPKSAHYLVDPFLEAFTKPSFDPAAYLNAKLPALHPNAIQSSGANVPLAELSTTTQNLLSQLNSQSMRLTTALTQITDEILRSGSRLAYEVEVLRGETVNLSETLTESLQDDARKFVPAGLENFSIKSKAGKIEADSDLTTVQEPSENHEGIPIVADPPYLQQLRILTSVQSRLEMVIKTFGDAMAWTFPPSEVSVASSFISVSAPETSSDSRSLEEKGQQVSKNLRNEIADFLRGDDPILGIESAATKIEELKKLAIVWRGTSEEKARVKFVEDLSRMVEEKHRALLGDVHQNSKRLQNHRKLQSVDKDAEESIKPNSGFGFISQLQKFRGAS
ncbi:hypothetical protein K3495_g11599 [Podosphaera aphanis]|nr:hypothetical protein K3495_g11599 [Podosphaera aphanis]